MCPQGGITVFAGLPHTHTLGRRVKMRHIRDGAELPTAFLDSYYDFNYQTMRRVEFQMLPGDHIILECGYDTTTRLSYTRGGLSVQDEMCMMFLHYYPATTLAHCVSKLPLKNILLAMGVTLWPVSSSTKQLGLRIRSPVRYQNLTLTDYLGVVLPGDMDAAKRLQEANLHHSQQAECYDFGRENVIAVSSVQYAVWSRGTCNIHIRHVSRLNSAVRSHASWPGLPSSAAPWATDL